MAEIITPIDFKQGFVVKKESRNLKKFYRTDNAGVRFRFIAGTFKMLLDAVTVKMKHGQVDEKKFFIHERKKSFARQILEKTWDGDILDVATPEGRLEASKRFMAAAFLLEYFTLHERLIIGLIKYEEATYIVYVEKSANSSDLICTTETITGEAPLASFYGNFLSRHAE